MNSAVLRHNASGTTNATDEALEAVADAKSKNVVFTTASEYLNVLQKKGGGA